MYRDLPCVKRFITCLEAAVRVVCNPLNTDGDRFIYISSAFPSFTVFLQDTSYVNPCVADFWKKSFQPLLH